MAKEMIEGVLVRPGQPAEVSSMENSLKGMQEIVGGYVETLHLFDDLRLVCLIDEEGKFKKGKGQNIYLLKDGQLLDYVAGDAFFCYTSENLEEFESLPDCFRNALLKEFGGESHVISF